MHTQEIAVGNQTTINVTLQEESIGLEEIVAVGYGTQKKETLSGSVASISADEIASTKSENLISNIQGKVPGLLIRQLTGEPGKFNNYVSIRGFGAPWSSSTASSVTAPKIWRNSTPMILKACRC